MDIDNNNDIIFPLSCDNNENDINKINKIFYALSLIKNEDKIPKSMNNKNKLKDKIKLVKKIKLKEKKYQSDICHSKYNEDLSFTNISDISEIKQSSIMSPCYINTNIEGGIWDLNKYKQEILNQYKWESTIIQYMEKDANLKEEQKKVLKARIEERRKLIDKEIKDSAQAEAAEVEEEKEEEKPKEEEKKKEEPKKEDKKKY